MKIITGALCVLFLLTACSEKVDKPSESSSSKSRSKAPLVEYRDISRYVGQRVTVQGWVFGEGKAYKIQGQGEEFYFVLCPVKEPQPDWATFFDQYDELNALVTRVNDSTADRAPSSYVMKFSRLARPTDSMRQTLNSRETEPETQIWVVFNRNVINARFEGLTDMPSLLVNPSKSELLSAIDQLLKRYKALSESKEFEITGTLESTKDINREHSGTFMEDLRSKDYIIFVDDYKVLRTALDVAEEQRAKLSKPTIE